MLPKSLSLRALTHSRAVIHREILWKKSRFFVLSTFWTQKWSLLCIKSKPKEQQAHTKSQCPHLFPPFLSVEKQCTRKARTCHISVSLNEQFVLGKSATKKQGIDWMPSFIHTFYNMTSSVLQENSATQLKWIEPIFSSFELTFRVVLKRTYLTWNSKKWPTSFQGVLGVKRGNWERDW